MGTAVKSEKRPTFRELKTLNFIIFLRDHVKENITAKMAHWNIAFEWFLWLSSFSAHGVFCGLLIENIWELFIGQMNGEHGRIPKWILISFYYLLEKD